MRIASESVRLQGAGRICRRALGTGYKQGYGRIGVPAPESFRTRSVEEVTGFMKRFGTRLVLCSLTASMLLSGTALAAVPQWSAGNVYVAGNEVTYDGDTYRARWWSQNEVPGSSAWGAWEKVTKETAETPEDPGSSQTPDPSTTPETPASGVPAWDASAVYTGGMKALYNGSTYEARWWVTGEKPDSSDAWKKIGSSGETPETPETPVQPSEPEKNTAPVLSGVKDTVEVSVGDTIDVLSGITATDAEDGDLTGKVRVTGSVDTGTAGTYVVTYTVTDSRGESASAKTTFVVREKETMNTAPVLSGVKDTVEVSVGDSVDVLSGITARDAEDGDLTGKIKVTGAVDTGTAGTYVITYTVTDSKGESASAKTTFTVNKKETETPVDPDHSEPPVPFWKDYKNYPAKNTQVYYRGRVYQNKWYANAGTKPDSGDPWVLVGDAEWTVAEKDSNYTKEQAGTGSESGTAETVFDKVLTDSEIQELYGGINPAYSPEAAVNRLGALIPKKAYEELFPYRFGSPKWKACAATRQYYSDPSKYPDYYSYENLQEAVHTLANTVIKVQWYEGATWCYRLIRLNKTTKEQKLIYSDPNFDAEWLQTKPLCTSICDYGSFLAEGDLNTRKRELAGFLANISHETGGGSVDGTIDDSLTGLYFNEEVGFIGSSQIGYVQSSGTKYLPAAGKSYHGRGPIQLSYNYNYGLCSDVLYGDSSILLNDPDRLEQDGVLGFMTGIWFWMTPQPPKPSCHQVITGTWAPKEGAANASYNGNFGLTIVIINNEAGQSENGSGAVARRSRYYRIFAGRMGADISGEHVDTMGMTTFTQ